MVVIVMGVSGSGKTRIGTLLASRTGVVFADADDYHSAANKVKMATGNPLTDEDRQPWLEHLNGILRGWAEAGKGGVMACSALKESYRETLEAAIPCTEISFVMLDVSAEIIATRIAGRHHEFMSPALLGSQLATLEPPSGEEAVHVCNDRSPDVVVDEILQHAVPRDEISNPAAVPAAT